MYLLKSAIESIPTIPEKISGKDFNNIVCKFTHYKEGDCVPVKIFLTVRTKWSNKVLLVEEGGELHASFLFDLCPLITEGYYNILYNVRDFLLRRYNEEFFTKAMHTSFLQTIGFLFKDDLLVISLHLLIDDIYAENGVFIASDPDKSGKFVDILSLSTFTKLSSWSKLIVPTLKIVDSE